MSFSLSYNEVALKEAMWHLQHLFQSIFPLNIVYLSENVTGCEGYPFMSFLEILSLHEANFIASQTCSPCLELQFFISGS